MFWRFKSEMIAEKKKAFVYKLGPHDFALFTSPIGFHRGRTFVFRCEDVEGAERWTETISRLLNARLEKAVKATTALFNVRKRVRSTYIGDYCQIGVATLIGVISRVSVLPAASSPTPCKCNLCMTSPQCLADALSLRCCHTRAGQLHVEYLPGAS